MIGSNSLIWQPVQCGTQDVRLNRVLGISEAMAKMGGRHLGDIHSTHSAARRQLGLTSETGKRVKKRLLNRLGGFTKTVSEAGDLLTKGASDCTM